MKKLKLIIIYLFFTIEVCAETINLECKNHKHLNAIVPQDYPNFFFKVKPDENYNDMWNAFSGIKEKKYGSIFFKFGNIETNLPLIQNNDEFIETMYLGGLKNNLSYLYLLKISRYSGILSTETYEVNMREFANKFDIYSKYNQHLSVDNIIENLLNKDEKFKLIKKNQNQCNKISKKF